MRHMTLKCMLIECTSSMLDNREGSCVDEMGPKIVEPVGVRQGLLSWISFDDVGFGGPTLLLSSW